MIDWHPMTDTLPEEGTRVLIKIKRRNEVVVAYVSSGDGLVPPGFDADGEYFRLKYVSHWALVNMPK